MGEVASFVRGMLGDGDATIDRPSGGEMSPHRAGFIADLRKEVVFLLRFSIAHFIIFGLSAAYSVREVIDGRSLPIFVTIIAILNLYWLITSIREIRFLIDRIEILSESRKMHRVRGEAAAFLS